MYLIISVNEIDLFNIPLKGYIKIFHAGSRKKSKISWMEQALLGWFVGKCLILCPDTFRPYKHKHCSCGKFPRIKTITRVKFRETFINPFLEE